MNNFILSYNPLSQFPSEGQLLTLLRINRHVLQFHQPFFGTYLIKSNDTAYNLNESFKGIFENTPYVLTQINTNYTSGSLPEEVWRWLNFNAVPPPPPQISPTPTRSIGSLLFGDTTNDLLK